MRLTVKISLSCLQQLLTLLLMVPLIGLAADLPELPPYRVDLSRTTVSGISSGAFMAAQFHIAYSSIVVGAGLIAGGPYYCAGSATGKPFQITAMTTCMRPYGSGPDAQRLVRQAQIFARTGRIDELHNLKNHKVYLFSGMADRVVNTSVVDQTAAFYRAAGVPAKNIRYVRDVNAGHAILTDNQSDVGCALTDSPYINGCGFMQSHDILKHLYPNLKPAAPTARGTLLRFDQSEFAPVAKLGMAPAAYAYIPKACERASCAVHIAFHGCGQSEDAIGERFVRSTGYNELADTNQLIVLYPQVRTSSLYPYNPAGCWDFWGYASINPYQPDFYSKRAPQMAAIRDMLARLAATP